MAVFAQPTEATSAFGQRERDEYAALTPSSPTGSFPQRERYGFTDLPDAPFFAPSFTTLEGVAAAETSAVTFTFGIATVPSVPSLSDTIRGGLLVIISSDNLRDTSRDQALTSAPAGWASTGLVEYSPRTGARLKGAAELTSSDADYVHFDASVDVRPVAPATASGVTELACLERGVARVVIARGLGSEPNRLVAFGEPDGGIAFAPSGDTLKLRLVQSGTRVYGYVDDIEVLNAPLTPTAGPITLATRELSSPRVPETFFTNFTVRPHAAVNDRLLLNKQLATERQLIGNVPAATLEELGEAEIRVFGLFGLVSSNGFTYTLPAPRTVGNEVVRTLRTYQDPVLRDSSKE